MIAFSGCLLSLLPKFVCSDSAVAHCVLKQLQQMHEVDKLVVHKVLLKLLMRHVELMVVCRRPLPSHSQPLASSANLLRVKSTAHLLAFALLAFAPPPLSPSGAVETVPGHHAHLATHPPKVPVTLHVLPEYCFGNQ